MQCEVTMIQMFLSYEGDFFDGVWILCSSCFNFVTACQIKLTQSEVEFDQLLPMLL